MPSNLFQLYFFFFPLLWERRKKASFQHNKKIKGYQEAAQGLFVACQANLCSP